MVKCYGSIKLDVSDSTYNYYQIKVLNHTANEDDRTYLMVRFNIDSKIDKLLKNNLNKFFEITFEDAINWKGIGAKILNENIK